jgi:hypothetical protein
MAVILIKESRETGCRWCGEDSYGHGCKFSPSGKHERVPVGADSCVYCGSSSYGRGCPYGDDSKHRHGSSGDKCQFCGSKSLGRGCPHGPNGIHVR